MEPVFLAFDVGGTRIKAGRVEGARVHDLRTVPSGATAEEMLKAVAEVGKELLDGRPCAGAGLCVPGLVGDDGRVTTLPGKLEGIVGVDLPAVLRDAVGARRAVVVNDAIAYGAGEAAAGAAAGAARAVVATIGTGVGCAVLEHGRPLGGGPLGGGLLGGQIPISEALDGPLDTNGKPGTIEALCRAQRIVELVAEEGEPAGSVEEVFAQHAASAPGARRAIVRYRSHLARAVAALAHAHGPEVVVLGGGPVVPGNPLLPGLEAMVNERLWYRVRVVEAALGDAAALVGLAHLAAEDTR